MELQKIIKDISNERLEPYLKHCNGNIQEAFTLYEYNTKISQTFYTTLSALEVTLRNKIDQSFKDHFNDEFWLDQVLPQFMSRQVEEIKVKLNQRKKTPTNSRVLAELNFGFWTILFNRNNAKAFWKPLHRIFEHIPKKDRKRSEISSKLNNIRAFRNRIYHYEPIIWNAEILDQKHREIFEVMYWLNPDIKECIQSIDTYESIKFQKYPNQTHNPFS